MKTDRLVVEQQRIGAGVVWTQRFTVEGARIMLCGLEGAAIEHQVAANFAYAGASQSLHEEPQVFDHQLRIAAAAQPQVAFEHAIFQRCRRHQIGAPLILGPEQFEPRERRHELHRRRRIHGLIFVSRQRQA